MADRVWNTGVYEIRHIKSGKRYVGSAAISFEQRFKSHRECLRSGRHCNQHLQNAWNKYGENEFLFLILERCQPGTCVEREQYWIDTFKVANRRFGYNKSPTAGSPLGYKHSPEAKENFSRAMRKRMESAEERMKVGNAMRGKHHSEETKKRLSETSKKMWKDPTIKSRMLIAFDERQKDMTVRQRIIAANTGKKRTDETKRKISEGNRGKKMSTETRLKMSLAKKGKKQPRDLVEKRAAKIRGRKRDSELMKRIASKNQGQKRSAESRAKMSASQKLRFQRPEERKKNQLINVGRTLTLEHRSAIRAGNLRPDTRLRKSEAAKKQWERARLCQK